MEKYRVYAKILGYILPSVKTNISNCTIHKMSFAEQKKRNFAPLKGDLQNPSYYKNYLTYPRGADFRILKSDFVISTDIEASDANSALGASFNRFDKVVGSLSLTASWWFYKNYNREILYKNYDYQICKIYRIQDGVEKVEKEPLAISNCIRMPNWPEPQNFSVLDSNFLFRLYRCEDSVFKKSLYYLVEATKSINRDDPDIVGFLESFKSIELIIRTFKGRSFKTKVEKAVKKLNLSPKDKDRILNVYKVRCDFDFAHASKSLWGENLPPQYPAPGHRPPVPVMFMEVQDLAVKILIKYFQYVDGIIKIILNEENDEEDKMDELIEVNFGEYYLFKTNENNSKKLTVLLKKKIAKYFRMKISLIKKIKSQKNAVFLKIDWLKS